VSRKRNRKFVTENKRHGPGDGTVVMQSPIPGGQYLLSERNIEILTGVVLFILGAYHSILYFGHTIVPIGDFPDFFRVGRELLSLQMPSSFKLAPVLGLLQNLLTFVSWGPAPDLTAGWLLNAILHPFTVVLLWQVGKRILGRSAVWFAIIAAINPWTIYMLTEPIVETTFLFFIALTIFLIFRRSRWAYLFASITTMVRYEGAALIMAAFVADIIHRKNRRDIMKAIGYSALAILPLAIWLIMTVVTWHGGTTHYFSVFFSKEYSNGFVEPASNRTGLGLHLNLLWQTGFQPLLVPYAGAGVDFAEVIFKLSRAVGVIGFLLGCVFAVIKRRWEVLILLLFFIPYFVLHAYYPYPLTRFHSTIFWIALLIAWFGLQSAGGALSQKAIWPRWIAYSVYIALAVAACAWSIALASHFAEAATISPVSASMPYVAMLVAVVIAVARASERRHLFTRYLFTASALCLVIASNQFVLARLVGDGKREIEFKQLGEWFAAAGRPDEKLAVYNNGPTQLYAGKNAQNVVGFPKAENPKELAEKLREKGVTYVVWATREGLSHGQHTGYRQLGLDKNIAFLDKPRSIGCYEFVRPIGSSRGFVNVFRLKESGEEQLPKNGNDR
jgi:hypothetical protein